MDIKIIEKYGNRLRLRVNGLCWKDHKLLLVNHNFHEKGNFWAPPGGGVDFGETIQHALVREFQEETSVHISPLRFLFGCEFIKMPLHAIELFYEVKHEAGKEMLGSDPESPANNQLIQAVEYVDFDSLMAFKEDERHGIFRFVKNATELKNLTGFYRI